MEQLYAKASTGKIKCWRIEAIDGHMITHHGYVNGKIQTKSKPIKGKNIGKSNETTPQEQALKESKSKWQKKVDKGYTTDPSGESDVRLPMLAQPFNKSRHRIKYPAFIQPKLNGVRCFAKRTGDDIKYTSRKGKSFDATLQHLTPYLLKTMHDGEIFDGEIYVHGWNFQQIIRKVKKLRHNSNLLQYYVYDVADKDKSFLERLTRVKTAAYGLVISVPTEMISSEAEVRVNHQNYVSEGYEGTIIRNKNSGYKFNHRSPDLQKLKDFFECEVTIIGGKAGTGTEDGAVVFHVRNGDVEFSVRPKGTIEMRREWMKNLDNIIGKPLTVRYNEFSEDNVPINPVGIAIRDYE